MKILFLLLVFCACQAFVQGGRSREELEAMRERLRNGESALGGDDDGEVVNQCKELKNMENMDDKDGMCEYIFSEIDSTARRSEKDSAKKLALDCLRDDTKLVERLKGTGDSKPYYLEEFVNLQVTKARTYYENGRTSRNPLESNVKDKIFLRLVPAELRDTLQNSDFPVANNADDDAKEKNRAAAYKVLRIACGFDDDDSESTAWTEVKASICTSNWGDESSSTVQNIFKASLIDTYTKFALDDDDGYKERVQRATNLVELGKRWKKVTEIIMNIGAYKNRAKGLKEFCLDDDTPVDTKTRMVFKRLTGIARQLKPSDAGDDFCPNADTTTEITPDIGLICSDGVGGGPAVEGMQETSGPAVQGPK